MAEYDASRAAYALTRRPDPRLAAAIERALDDARSVVNVGAGAGSYEPDDRDVIAVEPSATMRAQRPPGAVEAIDARAEELPLGDDSVDAAMAILTVHHWDDPQRGLAEMRRVARRRAVVLTFDPLQSNALWLVRDYLPQIAELDTQRIPPVALVEEALGGRTRVERLPVPHDCRDGFLGAYWRRPERYLDARSRSAISAFAGIEAEVLEQALARLRNDVDSGAWRRRYGGLLARDELDVGYRLVVADTSSR